MRELGCAHSEVGHAEQRRLFGEDDDAVGRKTAAALRHGLVPVLCVGEPDRVPADAAARYCTDEVDRLLAPARADGRLGPVTVAYEPHWAIGADEPAPVEHIVEACQALSDALTQTLTDATVADGAPADSRVVWGGSAGPGLLTLLGPAVDGLFLGRFAHDPQAWPPASTRWSRCAARSPDQRLGHDMWSRSMMS